VVPLSSSQADRAYGALLGLAIGDALGMPTQGLSRALIKSRWGVLDDFVAAPDDNPISRSMPAGRVTDDTDQALILGRLLVSGGGTLDAYALAAALLEWQRELVEQGSIDLLGPSTLRALRALQTGVPIEETGRDGDTNGAAMRIAPVGVATSHEPLLALVDAVEEASRLTHNTGAAIAGAAAIAAAVSAGVGGLSTTVALDCALAAARRGAVRGTCSDGAGVADRVERAVDLVTAARTPADVLDVVDRLVGTSLATHESVPAALALVAAFPGEPWEVCRHAASVGGDCDTIAAMAGAVAGALNGAAAFPPAAVATLLAANRDLELERLSRDLLALRGGPLRPPEGDASTSACRVVTSSTAEEPEQDPK